MIKERGLKQGDAGELSELDKLCFSVPWSERSFQNEIENELAHYIILTDNNKIIGYAGLWDIVGEGHITNIGVHPHYRKQGLGKRLIAGLLRIARERKLSALTLEVRKNNSVARRLYSRFGFKEMGIRKGYYSDTNEDAIIMTLKLFGSTEEYFRKIGDKK